MAEVVKREKQKVKSKGKSLQGIKRYFPSEIEKKWQKVWEDAKLYDFKLDPQKQKAYILVELPYPSGDLHIGHWFNWVTPDAYARFLRMSGKNVFFPHGFDAFGLPAENAAIKRNIHPQDWTMGNIEKMTNQFKTMGTMLRFSDVVITCLPEYYRWNQWIFLKMYEKGLAYLGKSLSNWCPNCQTVLANENVEQGKCWRCGTEVVQKEVEQWFLKITDYADKLIWPENTPFNWPQSVREGQNNWIGKKEGAVIKFKIQNSKIKNTDQNSKFEDIEVFTTRPDTLYGATFLVVAPEHPVVASLLISGLKTQNSKVEEIKQYLERAKGKSEMERKEEKEKTGVFSGLYAINPVNNEHIPVWIADYVLMGYGTGAIMAVPAHDERDFEFARKYNLPIQEVVAMETGEKRENEERRDGGCAIIFDPEAQKYAVSYYPDGLYRLFGGGADGMEDKKEATVREVTEESGLYDFSYIEKIRAYFAHYYNFRKRVNRSALATNYLFILKSKQQKPTKLESHEQGMRLVWQSATDILQNWQEWQSKNPKTRHNIDHWIDFLKEATARAIELGYDKTSNPAEFQMKAFTGEGMIINSGEWDGLSTPESIGKVIAWLEKKGYGKSAVTYHLRDWSISRQRYWGTPIPVIHCDECGTVPVPEKDLPVTLPYDVDYTPKGKPPLASNEKWLSVVCPKCGKPAKRDAQTMDTFFDSAWYYYRYVTPHDQKEPFDKTEVEKLMPVDVYFGGGEHTLGHTLYARFFTKFFKNIGLVSFDEFARRRVQHGIVLGTDGEKMSKSKGNVINPDDVVGEFGADAVRVYLYFMMPYEATGPWSTSTMYGMYRFLRRIWDLQEKVDYKIKLSRPDESKMHQVIAKVSEDIAQIKMNTAIAALMDWLNYLSRKEAVAVEEYKTMLLLLAPFAPHISEELYQGIRNQESGIRKKAGNDAPSFMNHEAYISIHTLPWPIFDPEKIVSDTVVIAVQINGKLRDTLTVESSKIKDQKSVEDLAKELPNVTRHLQGKTIRKIIYVPAKILNFVAA